MPLIPRRERMDIAGITRSATREFPAAVDALHTAYPEYDYVWDRQKQRWLVVRWLDYPAKNNPCPIHYLEDEDRGTPQDPGQHAIDWLKATDIARRAGEFTDVLDEIDRRWERWREQEQVKVEQQQTDLTAPFLDYIRRNPTSVQVRGWTQAHLWGVRQALKEGVSHGSSGPEAA